MTGPTPARTAENDAPRLANACKCGDCYHPVIGPNADGEPCDWCRDCGCHADDHTRMSRVIPPEQSAENDAAVAALERLADQAWHTAGDVEGRERVHEDRAMVLGALTRPILPGSTGEATR